MNNLFYLFSAASLIYCVETAIKMSLRTNWLFTLSLLLFSGICFGACVYVYFFGARAFDVALMAGIVFILYSNKRMPHTHNN